MTRDLTKGNIIGNLLYFSIPYLLSCFLQTFYGLADLFFIGKFDTTEATVGVSNGSQIMHMVTLIIAGLAMGTTVLVGNALGAKDDKKISKGIGNTITLFAIIAVIFTALFIVLRYPIINVLRTPTDAVDESATYLLICFLGIPFITAYNVISSIFRGLGDTKRPLLFVAIAGVVNVLLDLVLIGPGQMGAAGAAVATVTAQAVSVVVSLIYMLKKHIGNISISDLAPNARVIRSILNIGVPIAAQDTFIQVAFLVITAIANNRGMEMAGAVGVVEKIISFLFLVPSAMLSSVSAIASQNAGAKQHDRALKTLWIAMAICVVYGALTVVLCELIPEQMVGLFTKDAAVIPYGEQYLRSYTFDTMFAGIHFCFNGFFCAYNRSIYSFIMNIGSIILIRIPGAWLASVIFPQTLIPMGMAAPLGSIFSAVVGALLFVYMRRQKKNNVFA